MHLFVGSTLNLCLPGLGQDWNSLVGYKLEDVLIK